MDFQVISDETGKVLAVLSFCTLDCAMRIATEYKRVLGVPTYRNTMRLREGAPVVGSRLPELVREVRP